MEKSNKSQKSCERHLTSSLDSTNVLTQNLGAPDFSWFSLIFLSSRLNESPAERLRVVATVSVQAAA